MEFHQRYEKHQRKIYFTFVIGRKNIYVFYFTRSITPLHVKPPKIFRAPQNSPSQCRCQLRKGTAQIFRSLRSNTRHSEPPKFHPFYHQPKRFKTCPQDHRQMRFTLNICLKFGFSQSSKVTSVPFGRLPPMQPLRLLSHAPVASFLKKIEIFSVKIRKIGTNFSIDTNNQREFSQNFPEFFL